MSFRRSCGAIGLGALILASVADSRALARTSEREEAPFAELPEPPESGDVTFRAWAERVGAAGGMWLGALWTVELDGDPTLERAARLCGDEQDVLLIEDPDSGQRWRVSATAWDRAPACPTAKTIVWEHLDEGLAIVDVAPGGYREQWLGLRGGRLVETARVEGSSGASIHAFEVRWDLATFMGTIELPAEPYRMLEREGWILATGAGIQQATTYVRAGGVHLNGDADASLALAAEMLEDDRVRLQIEVRDDDFVFAPDTSALTGVDHLEIWWAAPHADHTDPVGNEGSSHGLLVVPLEDGGVHTSWIGTSDEPLPEVSGAFTRLEIILPVKLRTGARQPFAVVFRDVDGRRGATPTVIATSRWQPSQPATFGWLVRHTEAGPFPLQGERIVEDDAFSPG